MRLVINKPNEGHGRHVLELLKTYAFEHVKCHRLWLDVRVHNERGISVYKRHQFVEEGTLRQCIKHNNGYYSIKIMSILKEEYEA
jgi:RimJ/RimL family protein N-acetyltransferase